MPSQHRFLTTGGTAIWFAAGRATDYTGSGTPWTSQSTTPFQIAMNQVTGPLWTPRPPEPQTIYGGGGVFRHGSAPVYSSLPNVTEDIPIQVHGTTHDNAVAAYRTLRAELLTALVSGPLLFVFQPDGATNAVFYEVSSATVQENPVSFNTEVRSNMIRAVITITRQPLGAPNALTTLINGVTVVNNSTSGSNQNSRAFGTLAGDLVNIGTPINVTLTPITATTSYARILLASIASRTTSTSGAGAKSTSSTTGVNVASPTFTVAAAQTNLALKPRFLLRFTSMDATAEVRIRVLTGELGLAETTIYTSPWIGRNGTSGQLLDFGTWSWHYLRAINAASTTFAVYVDLRSTSGALTNATIDYHELLLYYDYCQIDFAQSSTTFNDYHAEGLRRAPNGPYQPRYPVYPFMEVSKVAFVAPPPRGTFPRAYTGASLWVNFYTTGLQHDKTETATLTVQYAPMYMTVRGAG